MEGHIQTENHDILSALKEKLEEKSNYIENVMREILGLMREPDVKVIQTFCSDRLEHFRVAKYVAEEATKFRQYDAVILIDPRRDSSVEKMQMTIAEKLGVQLSTVKERDVAAAATEEDEEEENVYDVGKGAGKIFSELYNRKSKSLLILDFVRSDKIAVDLRKVGIHPELLTEAKLVLMTQRKTELHLPNYLKPDRGYELEIAMGDFVFDRTMYCVSEMLVAGATDVADSLRMHHHITLEPKTILACIAYLLLMPTPQGRVKEEELSRYYMGEGLIPFTVDGEEEDMNIDGASAVTKALLTEIVNHVIFESGGGTKEELKDIYVQMDPYLWESLITVKNEAPAMLRIATEREDMKKKTNWKWISLAMKNVSTLLPSPRYHAATTLLLFGNSEMKSIPDDLFEHMTSLRVLDLSCTGLSSLPSSISHLRNCLRFIKLQNCPSLETLPPSFKHLESLQLLDLCNTPLSTMLDDSFEHMCNLRLLDLSHTKISSLCSSISNCCKLEQLFLRGCQSLETIPQCVFRLEKLRLLDLSYASQLKSLPLPPQPLLPISSTSLKKLLLAHCKSLAFVFSPHLQQLSALEELDVSGCTVLGLEDSKGCMPNLRFLNISGSSTHLASLSLKQNFLSLEKIQLRHLTSLEYLDLSGTKIKEFPYEICELTRLKRLDLVNTRQLERVQWDKIKWLPQILNWDQCGCRGINEEFRKMQLISTNDGGASALISVGNGNIFKNLKESSPLWNNCFTRFCVHVSPCAWQQQLLNKVPAPDFSKKRQFPYRRVHERMKGKLVAAPARSCRHLEMDGVKSLNRVGLAGIKAIARWTESLWLRDDDFLASLTDLDLEDNEIVKECRIERCHNMRNIFDKIAGTYIRGLSRLWVSELLKLETLYNGRRDFHSLQHLYLWWCPNLTSLFNFNPYLRKLETLEISFCPRLKCIFQEIGPWGEEAFPQLHTLCLWDLRKLDFVCRGHLPALKKLKVGRCSKLQKLPILPPLSNNGDPNAPQSIEIQGESEWCNNIRWAETYEGYRGQRRPIILNKVPSPRWCYNNHRN